MSQLETFVSAHLEIPSTTTVPFNCRRATVPYAGIDQTYSCDENAGEFGRGAEQVAARLDRFFSAAAEEQR